MALAITHTFQPTIADDPADAAAGRILPSHWKASHTFTGLVDATQLDPDAAYAFTGLGATVINQVSAGTLALTVGGGGNSTRQITLTPNSGVAYGVGSPNSGSGFIVFGSGNTQLWGVIGGNTLIPAGSTYGWVSGTVVTGTIDLSLSRAAPATLQMGVDSATPVAQKFQVANARAGTDSNVGGASITFDAGTGTGTGTLSTAALRSPVAVASGTGAQTMVAGITAKAGTAVLTSYIVANLPAAATAGAGATAFVTDANATFALGLGLAAVGGGANKVPVYSDATNWIIG